MLANFLWIQVLLFRLSNYLFAALIFFLFVFNLRSFLFINNNYSLTYTIHIWLYVFLLSLMPVSLFYGFFLCHVTLAFIWRARILFFLRLLFPEKFVKHSGNYLKMILRVEKRIIFNVFTMIAFPLKIYDRKCERFMFLSLG